MLRLVLALCLISVPLQASHSFESKELRTVPVYVGTGDAWPWAYGSAAAALTASASADLSKTSTHLTPYLFGANTSWWSRHAWSLDEDRVQKMKQAGLRFWRYPGGSSSDFYFWNGEYGKYAKSYNGDDSARMAAPENLDFDHFMELCKLTGSEPILTLNYGLARYGSLKEAIALATGWIQYAKKKGYKIRYAEIGNENYGNWEAGSDGVPGKERLTGSQYGKDVVAFVKALKAVDSRLNIGAVVVPDDGPEEWVGYFNWNKGVMTETKGVVDFYSVHEYFLWPFDKDKNYIWPTYEKLLGNLGRIGKIKTNLDDMQKRYTGGIVPVAFDEFNIINASPPATIETVNLLFTAGALGEMATQGFGTANIWDWKNDLDPKLKGDMGMLATTDPRLPEATPRPSYYAFALWARAGGDHLVASLASGVRAYASRFAGGQAGWVVINETEKPVDLTLSLKGYQGDGTANAWIARGLGMQDLRVRFNEIEGPAGGGGPFPIESIPPFKLQAKQGELKLNLPGSSAAGIVLY